jgi:2-polyprenyl-6-methoxyphenol hydroxylase-like FAD-dependent oxidoreductase
LTQAVAATRKVPLLIAGGGLGGLAAALALSRKGLASHVVEKSRQFGEIGAGLQIAPNAARILHDLGIMDEIRKTAVFPARLGFLDAITGEAVRIFDVGREFVARYGHPYFVMHRGDLLDAMLSGCRASPLITLEPSKDLVAIEDAGNGARASFADGTTYECDALIGADGLHSTVRRFVAGDGEPISHAYVAYRGAIPMEEVSKHAGDAVVMYMGPGLHFVQYPLRRGELYNQVAVFESKRFKPGDLAAETWGTPEEMDEAYAGTCDYVRGALKLIKRDRRWPMIDRLPISQWTRNRVVLMGDAAHPMLQYVAQGACQAIEDAACLAEEIARAGSDYPKGFAVYQERRYLRTARVQTTARFAGDYMFHLDGPARLVRNQLMEGSSPTDYTPLDWLYGYCG